MEVSSLLSLAADLSLLSTAELLSLSSVDNGEEMVMLPLPLVWARCGMSLRQLYAIHASSSVMVSLKRSAMCDLNQMVGMTQTLFRLSVKNRWGWESNRGRQSL